MSGREASLRALLAKPPGLTLTHLRQAAPPLGGCNRRMAAQSAAHRHWLGAYTQTAR